MLDAGQATAIVYPVPIDSYCRQALLKYFQLIHYRSIIYTWYFDVLELSKKLWCNLFRTLDGNNPLLLLL